jgi:hypothetical protein
MKSAQSCANAGPDFDVKYPVDVQLTSAVRLRLQNQGRFRVERELVDTLPYVERCSSHLRHPQGSEAI